MKSRVNRLAIVGAALLGVLVTFIYGFVVMLFFSAKEVPWWIDVFIGWPLNILCPTCYLSWHGASGFWFIATPFINAVLYGGVTYAYLKARILRAKPV
jgi:hypothetical protein